MRPLDLWLKVLLPVGFFMETKVFRLHSLEGGVNMTNKVIFASRSSGSFGTVIVEGLGYRLKLISALFGGFSFDNCVDGVLDILRRIGMDVDLGSRKMGEAVEGAGARRALGSGCLLGCIRCFGCGTP